MQVLHLPLQHGSDDILKRMGRCYTNSEFRDFVNEASDRIPDICIGSDVIVGFPGENEQHFNDCRVFIESLSLAYLHVFKYSKRPGTPAATFKDQVRSKTATERHKILTAAAERLSTEFMKKQIGKTVKVLFEEVKNGCLTGLTDNYIRVNVMTNENTVDRYPLTVNSNTEDQLRIKNCGLRIGNRTADDRQQAADSIQNSAYQNDSPLSTVNCQLSTEYPFFVPVRLISILKNRTMLGEICK